MKSISISRARSVTVLTEWDESFRTYGPFATMLNDAKFDDYHLFRAESHVLTDAPELGKHNGLWATAILILFTTRSTAYKPHS
jgi:hypothetical protein